MAPRLVLASASETRLRVLRQAGFDPVVEPSDVDEASTATDPAVLVRDLAYRKATAVSERFPDDVVLGCDSVVSVDGELLGKPSSTAQAADWWRSMRGRTATVWTGHALRLGSRSQVTGSSADVHFVHVTDAEIDAYVATGEGMGAAGGFRLDGRAAAFVESVTGDPGTVHGVSISALRDMLTELELEVADLWV